jgi:hypothetical protein
LWARAQLALPEVDGEQRVVPNLARDHRLLLQLRRPDAPGGKDASGVGAPAQRDEKRRNGDTVAGLASPSFRRFLSNISSTR